MQAFAVLYFPNFFNNLSGMFRQGDKYNAKLAFLGENPTLNHLISLPFANL